MFFRSAVTAVLLVSSLVQAKDKEQFHYLALGDSITFGLDITKLTQPPALPTPSTAFTGYPEILDGSTGIPEVSQLVNLSCPGETSASFLDVSKPDNDCHFRSMLQPGYKAYYGLHSAYQTDLVGPGGLPIQGAQLGEALVRLQQDQGIQLVTINLGGNDLLLLQGRCGLDPTCVVPQLPGVLSAYGQNLVSIFQAIRAKYSGTLVLITFYSPDYSNTPEGQLQMTSVSALNGVARLVALGFNVKIADGYTAFASAARSSGGDACKAGLLVPTGPTTCDVHPSQKGQTLLAQTVMDVYKSVR